ncbi:MAG: hypothetical protein KDB14_23300 [Planctomycetales bacterium]|nr:hypothetical protein [Planctomycetales bacterium]
MLAVYEKEHGMSRFASLSDEFYVNMNLSTEMELPQSRETVLHLFEQVRKRYPTMRNFYARERGEFVLEEEKEGGAYRWTSIEPKRICSGNVNPESVDDALEQHGVLLELAPYTLSVSPLDCEALNVMFGFDYTYRGNHNQLLVDALGISPALEKLVEIEGVKVVANEPSIQLAFDPDCRVQCRVSFETRTSAYHIRTGEFPEEQLSVYLTARRYGSLEPGETYQEVMQHLAGLCQSLIDNYVAENVLLPLQQTIAIR